jgi:hypothetical protein
MDQLAALLLVQKAGALVFTRLIGSVFHGVEPTGAAAFAPKRPPNFALR